MPVGDNTEILEQFQSSFISFGNILENKWRLFFDSKCNKLRINHYYMKSKKEYFEKLKRGWPICKHEEFSMEQMEKMFREKCDAGNIVYDAIMLRYIGRN